jgi:uncharacterized protein
LTFENGHAEWVMDHRPSVELLESTHFFPGVYQIKAIGRADGDFEARVVAAVYNHLAAQSDLDYSKRTTPTGRHLALTLDISVQTAEQVRAIYAEIREVEGLTLLF